MIRIKVSQKLFALPFCLLWMLLLSCQSLVSDKTMNKEGSKAFIAIKKKEKIETNKAVRAYVSCVAKAILQVAHDDTGVKEWELVVFKSPMLNAFALPGGKIGVYTGILKVAKTQGQLATIIGHEVAHVIKRHGKKRYSQSMLSNVGAQAVGLFYGRAAAGLAGAGLKYGLLLPFGRAHESEADLVGLKLMATAGFDPRESVRFWQNMATATKGAKSPPQFLSTHPSGKNRIKDLQKAMPRALLDYEIAKDRRRRPRCK